MAFYELPSTAAVEDSALLIKHIVNKTPVKTSRRLTEIANKNLQAQKLADSKSSIELYFKCENLQRTGSFKFRGACHFLAKLDDDALAKGVVAYSTGNHAQAVALAAQLASRKRNMHVPCYVVVPSNCPSAKISAAQDYGATVMHTGIDPNDRIMLAEEVQRATGSTLVPPADHVDIVLGQATAVQEFVQQATQMGRGLDAIIIPSGGGGLLCGAVAVCKPQGVAVFGAEPEYGGPGLATALEKGSRTTSIQGPISIADGLRSLTGQANWEHIRASGNVEQVFTVSEARIKEALKLAVEELGFVIEASAAVPLAVALFSHEFQRRIVAADRRMRVGVVLTGGNVSMDNLPAMIPGKIARSA